MRNNKISERLTALEMKAITPTPLHIIFRNYDETKEQAIDKYLAKHEFENVDEIRSRFLNGSDDRNDPIEFIVFKCEKAVKDIKIIGAKC